MGSYYAGVINSKYNSELKHFGILGQKWGIRRFQNPDGSLTPAGRERYYGDQQQEKIRSLVSKYREARGDENAATYRIRIMKSPQTKAISNAIKDECTKYIAEQNKGYRESNKFYNNEKLHLKYADMVADEEFDEGVKRGWFNDTEEERESYRWQVRYEDGDQGQVFDRFIKEEPNHPIAKAYKEADAKERDHWEKMVKVSKEMARELLGSNATEDEVRTFAHIARQGAEKMIDGQHMNIPKTGMPNTQKGSKFDGSPKAGMSTNPQDYGSAEFEKNYKKYQRLQGTKSLLGGDHSKDESVKVLTDYQNEIYKNRNKLRNKEKSDYKNSVADIASKYTDKYAKAVLKDMGYDTSPESIAWLKQQPWFYLGGASEIVF